MYYSTSFRYIHPKVSSSSHFLSIIDYLTYSITPELNDVAAGHLICYFLFTNLVELELLVAIVLSVLIVVLQVVCWSTSLIEVHNIFSLAACNNNFTQYRLLILQKKYGSAID